MTSFFDFPLQVVGNQLEIVYPTIRLKLANALLKWHPEDKSARLILMPWRDVFEKVRFIN